MSRCDHCRGRNSWDCDDPYYRVSEHNMCENFDLDFSTITDEQKETIQKIIMNEDNNQSYYYE